MHPAKRFTWPSLVVLVITAAGCASVEPRFYDPGAMRQIESWPLEFRYESGEMEERVEADGQREVRVRTEGRSARDLQLRDDLYFLLRDEHDVPVVADDQRAGASGSILIHPVHFAGGGFRSLDVRLESTSEDVLGRVRITNGDRNATYMDDYEFAQYSADAITNLIREGVQ